MMKKSSEASSELNRVGQNIEPSAACQAKPSAQNGASRKAKKHRQPSYDDGRVIADMSQVGEAMEAGRGLGGLGLLGQFRPPQGWQRARAKANLEQQRWLNERARQCQALDAELQEAGYSEDERIAYLEQAGLLRDPFSTRNQAPKLSKRESLSITLNAILAGLLVAAVYILAFGLLALLLYFLWK